MQADRTKRFWSTDGVDVAWHATAEEARARCADGLASEREAADEYGWSDVEELAWGEVRERVICTKRIEHHPHCGTDEIDQRDCHKDCPIFGSPHDEHLDFVLAPMDPTPTEPAVPAGPVSAQVVVDLVGLTGPVSDAWGVDVVAEWTDADREAVAEWAAALHVFASDNEDVDVPDVPSIVLPYLRGWGKADAISMMLDLAEPPKPDWRDAAWSLPRTDKP